MEMLTNPTVVIILQCKIRALYTLNLHSIICQLYLYKAVENMNYGGKRNWTWKLLCAKNFFALFCVFFLGMACLTSMNQCLIKSW